MSKEAINGLKTKDQSEFVLHKQKTISNINESLPPGWIQRHQQRGLESEKDLISGDSRVIQTESTGVLRNKLLRIIDSAENIVCVASFLIADSYIIESMLRASERDVRVYLLTASEIHLDKEPKEDNEFEAERLREHIKTLEKFAGRVLVRTGNNLHSKFVIVDPRSLQAQGFLLTANLTSEALTRNVEIGIELDSEDVSDLFHQFLIGFWRESSNELLGPGGISKAKPLKDRVITPPKRLLCTTSQLKTIRQKFESYIDAANSEIIVSSYGFDLKHESTQKIINSAKNGKKVRILARPRQNSTTMNSLIALTEAGAEIRGHPWLHAKLILVDTEEGWAGLVMTSNVESRGLDTGFESGISLQGKDAVDLKSNIEKWWENFPQLLFINKNLGDVEGDVRLWSNGYLKKSTIIKTCEEFLGDFTVKSFDEMDTFQPRLVSRNSINQGLKCHEYKFRWTLYPPKLPPNAKKISSEDEFEVFMYKEDVFIVVQRLAQLSKAKEIASKLQAKIVIK